MKHFGIIIFFFLLTFSCKKHIEPTPSCVCNDLQIITSFTEHEGIIIFSHDGKLYYLKTTKERLIFQSQYYTICADSSFRESIKLHKIMDQDTILFTGNLLSGTVCGSLPATPNSEPFPGIRITTIK